MLKQMDAASGAAVSCEPSVPPVEEKKKKRKASQDGQISKKAVNPPWETIAKKSRGKMCTKTTTRHSFMEKREKKSYNIFI